MTDRIQGCTELATRVLAPNPGPMTLEGTNSYILRDPGHHGVVVVDPGPADAGHLRRLLAHGAVELILLTHSHVDHSELAGRLSARTGAPVRAMDGAFCVSADPLRDGEEIFAGGVRIRVMSTPGHTADSVCFLLPEDRHGDGPPRGSILTGDTILGRGSSVIVPPGGTLHDCLASLERLITVGRVAVLPGHGPFGAALDVVAADYVRHRRRRLAAVVDALAQLGVRVPGEEVEPARLVDLVYPDLPAESRRGAELSIAAQLVHLREGESGRRSGEGAVVDP